MTSFLKSVFPKLLRISKTEISKNIFLPNKVQFKTFSGLVKPTSYEIVDSKKDEKEESLIKSALIQKIQENILKKNEPLFAIVHVSGKQFKITSGDIIVIEGYWPPNAGDKITLDKVMVLGGENFSLIGRPIIQKDLVNVEATVIEKTVSNTKTHFKKKRRKQYKRINFYRIPRTTLQINKIKYIGGGEGDCPNEK